MAALEAMGRGIPVSSFNLGGLGALIEHQKNGWLIAQGDLKGLAETIRNWQSLNASLRTELSENAMQTIEKRYSATAVLPRLLKDYAFFAKCPSA